MLSPLLGSVYLHYVLDRWFELKVEPGLRGQATLIRYADDLQHCGTPRQRGIAEFSPTVPECTREVSATTYPVNNRVEVWAEPVWLQELEAEPPYSQ